MTPQHRLLAQGSLRECADRLPTRGVKDHDLQEWHEHAQSIRNVTFALPVI